MENKSPITLIKLVLTTTLRQAFLFIVFANNIFAKDAKELKGWSFKIPQATVQGVVTSSQGEALSGVSINLKGTTVGTSTDSEGKFEINAPGNGVLIFTHVGYIKQEIPVDNRSIINVQLEEENKDLNEVVVVGYGTQKKKDLTGSVASLGGKDLQVAPTPNLFNNLAGKLTGVIVTQASGQPGYDQPEFSIRGKSTFGNNGALVLVDGIERPFGSIDPNDIESVKCSKDAASAAVYGEVAIWVVLITLKQGRAGKTQISY